MAPSREDEMDSKVFVKSLQPTTNGKLQGLELIGSDALTIRQTFFIFNTSWIAVQTANVSSGLGILIAICY